MWNLFVYKMQFQKFNFRKTFQLPISKSITSKYFFYLYMNTSLFYIFCYTYFFIYIFPFFWSLDIEKNGKIRVTYHFRVGQADAWTIYFEQFFYNWKKSIRFFVHFYFFMFIWFFFKFKIETDRVMKSALM